MTLAVLVGNTNTRFAWFRGRKLVSSRSVKTGRLLSRPDRLVGTRAGTHGIALASVVPAATRPLRAAVQRAFGRKPFVYSARSRTALAYEYDRRELGADRVCVAEGIHTRWPGNTICVDFGTATTINVITEDGRFLGGAILPGQRMMLRALHRSTGRLPLVRPGPTRRSIPQDTKSALLAGTRQLLLGGLSRIVDDIEAETGHAFRVVATGGDATAFRRKLKRIELVDPHLALRGLFELYRLNSERT